MNSSSNDKTFFCLFRGNLESIKTKKKWNVRLDDLPTKRVLLTDDERELIENIRKCKYAKEDAEKKVREHENCSDFYCNQRGLD